TTLFRSFERIGGEMIAALEAFLFQQRLDLRAGGEAGRTGEGDVHAEETGAEYPRVGHVAGGVAEEGDLAALERGEQIAVRAGPALGHGEGVGVDLAGVQDVGER